MVGSELYTGEEYSMVCDDVVQSSGRVFLDLFGVSIPRKATESVSG